jgi:hypothetical protein
LGKTERVGVPRGLFAPGLAGQGLHDGPHVLCRFQDDHPKAQLAPMTGGPPILIAFRRSEIDK